MSTGFAAPLLLPVKGPGDSELSVFRQFLRRGVICESRPGRALCRVPIGVFPLLLTEIDSFMRNSDHAPLKSINGGGMSLGAVILSRRGGEPVSGV